MNTYEALIIFKPFLDLETNADNALKALENLVHTLKGKVLNIDKTGRRRLSYDIQKFKDGFLVTLLLELPPQAITELRKHCQLSEDILRLTLVRLEQAELAFMRAPRPQRPLRPERGERFDRGDRPERPERGERPERFERGERDFPHQPRLAGERT